MQYSCSEYDNIVISQKNIYYKGIAMQQLLQSCNSKNVILINAILCCWSKLPMNYLFSCCITQKSPQTIWAATMCHKVATAIKFSMFFRFFVKNLFLQREFIKKVLHFLCHKLCLWFSLFYSIRAPNISWVFIIKCWYNAKHIAYQIIEYSMNFHIKK